jgi:hypothetical protein
MYTKAVAEQLSFKELAAIFAGLTAPVIAQATPEADLPACRFTRISNGDGQNGQIRSICDQCYTAAAISIEVEILEKGEREYVCVSVKYPS